MTCARQFEVGWADVDANSHMRNTAYLDWCVNQRIGYFAASGFGPAEFVRHRIGPVISRDEVEYFRELRLLDRCTVTMELAGLSPNGSRFRLRHELTREDGTTAARVTTTGGWLDLSARKLMVPPQGLVDAMQGLPRSPDFAVLPDSAGSR